MSGGICVVLTERGFWCCEAALVGRIFMLTSFGVVGMLLIMVEMRYVRCACVVFLTGRQSGSVTLHAWGYLCCADGTWILVL